MGPCPTKELIVLSALIDFSFPAFFLLIIWRSFSGSFNTTVSFVYLPDLPCTFLFALPFPHAGLSCRSALFRHEIAYVLGQMQNKVTVPALIKQLGDRDEEGMVRHECAEALGSIAEENCLEALKDFLKDSEAVVRESCEVALDMYEYENSSEFQYADGLHKVSEAAS